MIKITNKQNDSFRELIDKFDSIRNVGNSELQVSNTYIKDNIKTKGL